MLWREESHFNIEIVSGGLNIKVFHIIFNLWN